MEIVFKQVEDEIRRLVAENPEFIYVPPTGGEGDCVYLERDGEDGWRGSCLFGRVFLNLAGSEFIFRIRQCEDQICAALFAEFGVSVTNRQAMWSSEVQSQQDKGIPWGQCLTGADGLYPLGEGA